MSIPNDRATGATAARAAWLALALGLLAGLAWMVVAREGNLAWDDADYLRRGLQLSWHVADRGLSGLPTALARTLRERPKPPLLIAWIEAGSLAIGRSHPLGLIVFASVVPFGLLLAGVIAVARRRYGDRSALLAVLGLAASPMMLSFGAKVMVETFLALWVLLTYDSAAAFLERPSKRRALRLGAAIGLATMTKLTIPLFFAVPGLYALAIFARRHGLDRKALGLAGWVALPILVIAGPWLLANGPSAVRFALFSSRYQIVAEGRTDSVPTLDRLSMMAGNLTGRPLLATLAAVAVLSLGRGRGGKSHPPACPDDFAALSILGAASGAALLLIPTYFDPRFLLPVWPSLAVVLGGALHRAAAGSPARTVLAYGLLIPCLACSARSLRDEHRNTTYWNAQTLIDDLVARYGVKNLGNVGNCGDWNVCKTGLINELRRNPRDCFVLHDLSKDGPDELRKRVDRFDAIVVLDRGGLPPGFREAAPGLNRAYDAIEGVLGPDPRFERLPSGRIAGLPPLSVFVRRR